MERGQGTAGVYVDRAVALEAVHALDGDDGRDVLVGVGRRDLHGGEVCIEPGVPVQDEDPVRLTPAECLLHGAAGEQRRVLRAVLDRDAAIRETEKILDLLATVAVGHGRAVEAGRCELVHNEAQERPAGDGRHGLADIGHHVGEPGAEAARQHNGFAVRAHLLDTPEHVRLHSRAQRVVSGQVKLLDAEDLVAGNTDADIRDAGELGLFRSGERDHAHALGASDLHCLDDVGGVARRRDGEQDVARLAVAVDLLGEDADDRLVVAERRGQRRLRDERDGGKRALEPRGDVGAIHHSFICGA